MSKHKPGWTTPAGLPCFDDHQLANKVAALILPAEDHTRAVLLTVGLEPGKYGTLKQADRDWLMKKAQENSLLPRLPRRPPGQKCLYAQDPYSDRESEAMKKVLSEVVAAQVPALGGQMPVPPARRNW